MEKLILEIEQLKLKNNELEEKYKLVIEELKKK